MKTRNRRKQAQRFTDGIANPLMRVGTGTNNLFSRATGYRPQFVTMQRQELEWAYQSSWMAALSVDLVAEDMTREGIELKEAKPEVIDKINDIFDDYSILDKLCDTIKWSRLYGGAIAVMLIDGQEVNEPLTNVPYGSFKGIAVFDRWQLDNAANAELVQELGVNFGKPKYYRVINEKAEINFSNKKIHCTRVIRLDGRTMPYYLRQAYQGWGASIIEPAWSQIKGFDLGTQSATQLLSKTYLRYYKVEGLRDILTNELAAKGFLAQMDYVREFQSSEGMTLGDKEDDFQTFSYSFTGIPEVLIQLGQQVSGAFGIPLVRLFGQSPAGLNSTGESDLRNYYDNIKKLQRSMLRSNMKRLLDVVYQSVTGEKPPQEFSFDFTPLWQMSQTERSTVTQQTAATILDAWDRGAISLANALKELKQLSDTVGIFSSITNDDIAEAVEQEKNEVPMDVNQSDIDEYENFRKKQSQALPRADEDGSDRSLVSQKTNPDR